MTTDAPSAALVRAAERVAPLAPRTPRKAGRLDRLRVADYARRLDEGEDEIAAAWNTLSDPKLGIARWRGAPASSRPGDVAVTRKIAALLRRATPELMEEARDATLARIARMAGKALLTIDEVTTGDFEDPARARVQLDGAKTVIESLGIGPRAPFAATTNVQINVANVLDRLGRPGDA